MNALWFDVATLALEYINVIMFLIIVELMASTVKTGSRYNYCVGPNRSRLHSAGCNAIYATLAFAGIDILLSIIAAIGISIVIRWELIVKYINQLDANGTQSINNPADRPVV